MADIAAMVETLELYRSDRGVVPTTMEGLTQLVQTEYLAKVPLDPWGNNYRYFSDGQTFSVVSFGADGKLGGNGAEADVDSRNTVGVQPNKRVQPTASGRG